MEDLVDQKSLNTAIEEAEAMVGVVREPQMRAAAFAVVLSKMLDGGRAGSRSKPSSSPLVRERRGGETAPSRILGLKAEGFFKEQRALAEVRTELSIRGWHYAVTALSGVMQTLVQSRELRRVRVKLGNRQLWKYSNF